MDVLAIRGTKGNDMPNTATNAEFIRNFVRAAKFHAERCEGPALVMLIATGDFVSGYAHPVPPPALAPDTIEATLSAMAPLIADHADLNGDDVAGYAVVLPGERVAFGADRNGTTHHIQLPGAPTEPLRRDRWAGICDGLTAMINTAC